MSARNTHRRKTAASRGPDSVVPVRLVSLPETAAIMGLSPRTLVRLVTLERMPGYRFAGMKNSSSSRKNCSRCSSQPSFDLFEAAEPHSRHRRHNERSTAGTDHSPAR